MTNKSAANRYARALLDVALTEKADLQAIDRSLGEFADLLDAFPNLQAVLVNPAVPVPRKRAAVEALLARTKAAPMVAKLVTLLAERDRLLLMRDIVSAFRDRLLDVQNVVRAEVTTAVPIPADRARAIETSLGRLTGRSVRLAAKVDPSIIGGVVTRIGDTVYDASITRQLEKLKERLTETV